ncbi:hypothetical protein CANARDRAFT_221704 [[Candida] arabinofermentans NRRL YB-2248]|uniref:RRM domain-containing protein n=1 Tax=[Candida] arabinofermentans NRRL YB-2248 TaxID=983967 RepID=A0A1E4T062_9ASCO|nr:hypothetical protein CANARDRAFT_221704 [[Candida] arabinofermentans NRRL YB-2248]
MSVDDSEYPKSDEGQDEVDSNFNAEKDTFYEFLKDDLLTIGDKLELINEIIKDKPYDFGIRLRKLQFLVDQDVQTLEREKIDGEAEFRESIFVLGDDITRSHQIWDLYFEYLLNTAKNDASFIEKLRLIWEERLAEPHLTIEQTFNDYTQFISKFYSETYSEMMIRASAIKNKTVKIVEALEPWELEILESPDTPSVWEGYIVCISKLKNLDRVTKNRLLKFTFKRAMWYVNTDKLIELRSLIKTYDSLGIAISRDVVYSEVLSYFDQNCYLWSDYIIESDISQFQDNFERVTKVIYSASDYDGFCALSSVFIRNCGLFFDQLPGPLKQSIISILSGDQSIFTQALEYNNVFHTIEKMCIGFFMKIENIDIVRLLSNKMLDDPQCGTQVEVILYVFEIEKQFGDFETALHVFTGTCARLSSLDWPERLMDEWQRYVMLFGKISHIEHYKEVCTNALLTVESNNATVDLQVVDDIPVPKSSEENTTNKRSRDGDSEEYSNFPNKKAKQRAEPATRNRENLTVLLSNIPPESTNSTIEKFFKDYGLIREIQICEDNATVEFTQEQDLLAALTRDHKYIKANEIGVTHLKDNTIWVTNFPPTYAESSLRELFSPFGVIMSVRLPSLASNVNRRFCYIDFTSSDSASKAAAEIDGLEITDSVHNKKFKLVVKISNLQKKKERSGALDEGRELYVSGLDYHKVDEETLRSHFNNYGEIESIKLPLGKRGQGTNRVNDGYGFISFSKKEEAQAAIQGMSNFVLFDRPLVVTLAVPKAKKTSNFHSTKESSTTRTPKSVIESKTISLLNLDDKVSQDHLLSILEEIGPVRKLELKPDMNGSLVEFENVNDCGKAEIKLNGFQIGDRKVTVGSRYELERSSGPKVNRRQRRQAILENKNKIQTSETLPEAPISETVVAKPKTNDDFRRMFLKN